MDSGQELLARLQTEIGRLVVINHEKQIMIEACTSRRNALAEVLEETVAERDEARALLTKPQRKKLGLDGEVSEGT